MAKYVRSNEVSLYQGYFPYIVLFFGQKNVRYIEVRYVEVALYNIYSCKGQFRLRIMTQLFLSQSSMSPSMLASPAGVFREEIRAPLKTPAGEAASTPNL